MIRQIGVFGVTEWIVTASVRDLSVDEWWERPGGANPPIWIMGHILSHRRILAGLLGFEVEPSEHDAPFARGTSPEDIPAGLVGAALVEEFRAFCKRFTEQLEAMDPARLDEPIDIEFPNVPKTRLGALQFLGMHESYHAGQLGQLRVQLGKGSWMTGE